jgi:hypothetical protein
MAASSEGEWRRLELPAGDDSYSVTAHSEASRCCLDSPPEMAPAWRLLLFGDGSPTKLLQVITGSPTTVHVLKMCPVESSGVAPAAVKLLAAPTVLREVRAGVPPGTCRGSWADAGVVNERTR